MSTGRRAYDILRGWVSHEWDRIREIERDIAEIELRDALDSPSHLPPKTEPRPATSFSDAEDAKAHARRLLGLGKDAGFEEVRKAFDHLNKRSDPARFPVGSGERAQAAEIQKRIHWAYQMLTESVDVTEKRFRSLEIE